MHDVVIIGGGVIGLSIAWQLGQRGRSVLLIDRHAAGTGTSWAGAGILPPARSKATYDPLEQLRTLSHQLHPQIQSELLRATGIDNQLKRCGGIYLSRTFGESIALRASILQSADEGVEVLELDRDRLRHLAPAISARMIDDTKAAYFLPDEMQIRSPAYLKALKAACEASGVEFCEHAEATELRVAAGSIRAVQILSIRSHETREIQAGQVCVTSGAWAGQLLGPLGIDLPIEPWRGQMALWKSPKPLLGQVVNEGLRYFVPRDDGHLLVGATVEDVGFEMQTTTEAVDELRQFSLEVLPSLQEAEFVRAWAGLRSGTPDGRPYLGLVPGFTNLSLAVGHFRSGLHLAPVTAVLMSQLLCGDSPAVDLGPFAVSR